MDNTFFNENTNKESFKSYLKDIYSFKVGFYSVGLYPASLAYNCAMHSDKKNILLAPRPGRNLLGAFKEEVLTQMDPKIIDEILLMGSSIKNERKEINNLSDLILKCNLVILASNSNHIQEDISLAIKLKKDLNRGNVVLACLVGSFCIDKYNQQPFILCEKYPNLAFFSGFHRHGALRNSKDSFSANFCHPDSFTALIGANILDQLSPKINVSAGVHNIECQYIKAIKNVSSIFAGFINKYHSDKPGMLPTINTVLLSQCFDQAATVSFLIRRKHKIKDQFLSLKELGYRYEIIKSQEIKNDQIFEKNDHTFSQLNAVIADVLGSMSLPIDGKPTRNFQAGQVLSEMIFQLKRCPKDIGEFIVWCNKYELSQGGLEGLKSLKFWPYIYKQYFIENNNSSMINLIYLCFYGNVSDKELIYEVLIDPEELINYSQESVKSSNSIEITNKLSGRDIFNDLDNLYEKIFFKNIDLNKDNSESIKNDTSKEKKYIKVMKLINKYFSN